MASPTNPNSPKVVVGCEGSPLRHKAASYGKKRPCPSFLGDAIELSHVGKQSPSGSDQATTQRKEKLIKLESEQEVPASPLLKQVSEACEVDFLSPADKVRVYLQSTSRELTSDSSTPPKLHSKTSLPVISQRLSVPVRSLHFNRVKRALNFNTPPLPSPSLIDSDRITTDCFLPNRLVSLNGREEGALAPLQGVGYHGYPQRGLEISTLLGSGTIILPDGCQQVPNPKADSHNHDRVDICNFSMLHYIPREE